MPYFRKKRLGKSRPRIGRKVVRKSPAKPSKTFTKLVKSIIHKQAETKSNSHIFALTQFNSGVNSSGDCLRILPQLSQGTGEAQRIGDSVRSQRLSIKGHFLINVSPTVSTTSSLPTAIPANARLMIRAFICSVKRFQNYTDVSANASAWTGHFLKNGNSSQTLDGTIESMYLPVNTHVITVHKEIKRYISIPMLTSTSSAAAPTSWIIGQSSDTRSSVKFFSLNLPFKKFLKYDDADFSPQNAAPFMVISYCHLDGSSPDVLTTVVSASFVSTLTYEDI